MSKELNIWFVGLVTVPSQTFGYLAQNWWTLKHSHHGKLYTMASDNFLVTKGV
jgi:hypothetical protein